MFHLLSHQPVCMIFKNRKYRNLLSQSSHLLVMTRESFFYKNKNKLLYNLHWIFNWQFKNCLVAKHYTSQTNKSIHSDNMLHTCATTKYRNQEILHNAIAKFSATIKRQCSFSSVLTIERHTLCGWITCKQLCDWSRIIYQSSLIS